MERTRVLPLEFQNVEFVQDTQPLQSEAYHALVQVKLFLGAVSGCVDDDFGLVAGLVEDGEFGGWWWGRAFDSPNADSAAINTSSRCSKPKGILAGYARTAPPGRRPISP